ncbi:MAG: energy transducer TonB [Azoarcus sp.]|jgi:protein TonB|nr:energy transducer TonB [Azoarcus sp.]
MATKQTHKSRSLSPLLGALGSPRNRHLLVGTAISIVAHVVVMLIHFSMPELANTRLPGLDVILVNARHDTAPKDPQALAQANLDGGGNSEEDVRAASPLPPQETTRDGNDLVDTRRQQSTPQQQDNQNVLTQEGSSVAVAQVQSDPDRPSAPKPASGADDADAMAMARQLEGEIAAKTEAYNKRPRKRQFGARTAAYRFALYIEEWRRKAERIGESNYPEVARGKLYGSLLITVSIRKDGSIDNIVINRPSQYEVLNEAALRIIRLGEPYAPFPPNIANDTDIIEISRTWSFTNDKLTSK